MAKKPGSGAFQIDIDNDEDLELFVHQPKLCHIYAGWCGPCLGMVSTLKRLKAEYGEDIQLATCKSDSIDALARFRNKSEPTWLICTQGILINILFSVNIPKLRAVVAQDMKKIKRRFSFGGFKPIRELLPMEQERANILFAEAEAERLSKERIEAAERRIYLNYVTEQILNYTSGNFGVTLFGPQVTRNHIPLIRKVAEAEKLSCQDINFVILKPKDIETLHYACNNKIPQVVLEQLYNKELMVMYWKCPYSVKRPIEEVLNDLVNKLTKSPPVPDGERQPSPLLKSLEIKIKPKKDTVSKLNIKSGNEDDESDIIKRKSGAEEGEEELEEEVYEEAEEEISEKTESEESLLARKSSSYLSKIVLPAMWTPGNMRTTAAAIYVFFRNQTTAYLPHEPGDDPPHLIVAFDAWKRLDVIDVMNKFSEDILAYGYFTNEEPETAELIANSNSAYAKRRIERSDKLIIKVAKITSHAVLAFAAHGPTYVSPNVNIGQAEAIQFFPSGYSNAVENSNPSPPPPPPPAPAPAPAPPRVEDKKGKKANDSEKERIKMDAAPLNSASGRISTRSA